MNSEESNMGLNCKVKEWMMTIGRVMVCIALITCYLSLVTSCSDETEVVGEWDNWETRNNETTDAWAANSSFRKIKTYTKDQTTLGKNSDYIYVQVLETGSGASTPLYTDTVRLAYRGRLIPTKSYADGYVFDQTYLGDFSWMTAAMVNFTTGTMVDGFATALMNMHAGDYWRVYIPYQLGYGTTSTDAIPGYSNLVFDIALLDTWHPGESRPAFRARQK